MSESQDVGACFVNSIQKYGLGLSHDFLTDTATDRSDHASFWQEDVGAVAICQNFFSDGLSGGCVGGDQNPAYHSTNDTMANVAAAFGFSIAKAAVATVAKMALPVATCAPPTPVAVATPTTGAIELDWDAVPGAASYRVRRSSHGCHGPWIALGETTTTSWIDGTGAGERSYEVEAVDAGGFCTSAASACVTTTPFAAPPGEPGTLLVSRTPGGDLGLAWDDAGASCLASSYGVYRGDLVELRAGDYAHDTQLACTQGGTSLSLPLTDPRLGDADYFLVVADDGSREGSYGRASSGAERPVSSAACRPTQDVSVCP
jgi:hypothetical protein